MSLQDTISHSDQRGFLDEILMRVENLGRHPLRCPIDSDKDFARSLPTKLLCAAAIFAAQVALLNNWYGATFSIFNHGKFKWTECIADGQKHSLTWSTRDIDEPAMLQN